MLLSMTTYSALLMVVLLTAAVVVVTHRLLQVATMEQLKLL